MSSVQIRVDSPVLGVITVEVEHPLTSWDDSFSRNQIRALLSDAVAKIHRAYGIEADA